MLRAHWFTFIIAILLMALASVSFGDDDEGGIFRIFKRQPGVAPVANATYKEECGSCHFAYQPGWLPASTWQNLMSKLDNHFSDNAELNQADHKTVLNYLLTNSADTSDYRRSKKIMRSVGDSTGILRITDTGYFKHEHDEIPNRLVADNDKVASFSHCDACHQDADQGVFSERNIQVPGYGRWDD